VDFAPTHDLREDPKGGLAGVIRDNKN
jgi:hypothetical protein